MLMGTVFRTTVWPRYRTVKWERRRIDRRSVVAASIGPSKRPAFSSGNVGDSQSGFCLGDFLSLSQVFSEACPPPAAALQCSTALVAQCVAASCLVQCPGAQHMITLQLAQDFVRPVMQSAGSAAPMRLAATRAYGGTPRRVALGRAQREVVKAQASLWRNDRFTADPVHNRCLARPPPRDVCPRLGPPRLLPLGRH